RPGPNETYADYTARLASLGFLGTITRVDLTDIDADPLTGPDAVARLRVKPGTATTATTYPRLTTIPAVRAGADLTLYVNPASAPAVPAEPGEPGGGSDPGSGDTAIDFSPITGLDFGCKFPFGLFCYAKDVTDWFRVTPVAPEFDFTFDHIAAPGGDVAIPGGGDYDVALGGVPGLNDYMAIWRALLSIALWVGAVWMLASRLLGLQLGDPGEAVDD